MPFHTKLLKWFAWIFKRTCHAESLIISETQLPWKVISNNYSLISCVIVHIYPLTLCSTLLFSFLKLFVPFIFAGVVLHSEKAVHFQCHATFKRIASRVNCLV